MTHQFVASKSSKVHLSRLKVILDLMNCNPSRRVICVKNVNIKTYMYFSKLVIIFHVSFLFRLTKITRSLPVSKIDGSNRETKIETTKGGGNKRRGGRGNEKKGEKRGKRRDDEEKKGENKEEEE